MDDLRGLKKKVYRLHNVVDAALQLNSVLEEEQIVRSFLLNLFGLISTRSIVILTAKTPYSRSFKPVYYQGLAKSRAEQLSIRKADPIFTLMQRHQNCINIPKHHHLTTNSQYLQLVAQNGGHLLTPLIHRNHKFGLVIIGKKHNEQEYSNSETEIFTLLTNFLAVALSNARMYKEMERISLTDPLTGLFNRRYFDNYLKTEVSRARRFNHPLSLVMMDVDSFKNYNDKLGHLNGDQLLKNLASILEGTIRCSDVVARYGGEEFCIILPEIEREGAQHFSERLRHTIYDHPFKKREIQPSGRISVSLGTATFPTDAQMTHELLEKADLAMYEAKRNGGNGVAAYCTS